LFGFDLVSCSGVFLVQGFVRWVLRHPGFLSGFSMRRVLPRFVLLQADFCPAGFLR
jgi:hypothetical protein